MRSGACGSGITFKGGFNRPLDLRLRNEPGVALRAQIEAALSQVFGVDVNPFAVAVARFRPPCRRTEGKRRSQADSSDFQINVAAGDSLPVIRVQRAGGGYRGTWKITFGITTTMRMPKKTATSGLAIPRRRWQSFLTSR